MAAVAILVKWPHLRNFSDVDNVYEFYFLLLWNVVLRKASNMRVLINSCVICITGLAVYCAKYIIYRPNKICLQETRMT